MCDVAGTGFSEDEVGHCMSDEAPDIDGVDVGFLCEVDVAYLSIDRNSFRDVEVVYGA